MMLITKLTDTAKTDINVLATDAAKLKAKAAKKSLAFYERVFVEGFRSDCFAAEIVDAASVATGESGTKPNPNYEWIWKRGVEAATASAKQLAYLKDSTGLSRADKEVRAETRKLGTDLVSNLIAGLKKKEAKDVRTALVAKIISKIDPLKHAEAVAKDVEARKEGKSARAVEKLNSNAVTQYDANQVEDNFDSSLSIALAKIVSTLKKHGKYSKERKYLDKWISEIDPQKQEDK